MNLDCKHISDDNFFNHIDICIFVYNGNIKGAIKVLEEKINKNFDKFCHYNIKLFANALNLAIYNYINIKENISLHKCCRENIELINNKLYFEKDLFLVGKLIIEAYGNCSDYLLEKYKNKYIKKALKIIQKNLSNIIYLEELSFEVGLSKNYFTVLFKKETGQGVNEYISKLRIKNAKKLLEDTNMFLEQISEMCGFNSSSYFCTVFKKETGFTSLNYRLEFLK